MGGRERREAALAMDFVQCEHCGRCLEVCPTYQALRTETMSARGRWDLIAGVASGELQPGPRYYESLSLCLNCMACTSMCPKGVDVEHMVREARAKFPRRPLKVYLNRAVFAAVLLNRSLLRVFLRLLAGARALLAEAGANTGKSPNSSPGRRPRCLAEENRPSIERPTRFQKPSRSECHGRSFSARSLSTEPEKKVTTTLSRHSRMLSAGIQKDIPEACSGLHSSADRLHRQDRDKGDAHFSGAAPAKGLSRHLPLFVSDLLSGSAIPEISGKSLFRLFPERISAAKEVPRRGEVTYFVGCFNALVDTAPAEAVIRVLAHNGYDVRLPRGQTCCAAPMLFLGDEAMMRRVMRKNLRVLQGEGPVLVSCATCGSMLRKEYPALAAGEGTGMAAAEGAGTAEAAARLARRTVDFVELLARAENLGEGRIPVRQRVTIHDPCDLVRGQGVSIEIRQLLKAVPGIEIVEMDHPDRCCGGGGTYSISHPEPAREIGRIKACEILDTGASLVVTACPGCILQIQRVLAADGNPLPVLHPAEVLAYTYGFRKTLDVP